MKALMAILACLLVGPQVRGMTMWSCDLDSLVYMSTLIVEGEVIRTNGANCEIEVSNIYKGDFKVGKTVETALDLYRKPIGEMFRGMSRLQEGDKLFLFLDPAERDRPVPSGVKFVIGDKAVGFSQYYGNPGPYVAESFGAETNTAVPTASELREQIRDSISRTDKWKPLLDRPASNDDVTTVLQLLRIRSTTSAHWMQRDVISETICTRLADLHNVDALVEALRVTNSRFENVSLGRGFGTPAGREFLLTAIRDKTQPIAERRKYASLLPDAGEVYLSTNTGPEWNAAELSAIKTNGHYLKRIAQTAAFNNLDPELRLDLLKFFQRLPYKFDKENPAIEEDVKDAEMVLKWYLAKTTAEDLRYELERALYINRDEDQLSADAPTIVSILKPRDPHDNYHPPSGRFSYEFDFFAPREGEWTTRVVFVNEKTGRKWTAPSSQCFHGGEQARGTDEVSLPADIPRGRYRVFCFLDIFSGSITGDLEFASHEVKHGE